MCSPNIFYTDVSKTYSGALAYQNIADIFVRVFVGGRRVVQSKDQDRPRWSIKPQIFWFTPSFDRIMGRLQPVLFSLTLVFGKSNVVLPYFLSSMAIPHLLIHGCFLGVSLAQTG